MNETANSAESIFAQAIEIAMPSDRAAFLERACEGDATFQEAVKKLVDDHFRAGSFLESPAFDFAATAELATISEAPGTIIGPYKLLQKIGEGGFGVVFMAEQSAPVRRKVALKVIKPGMDTRQVIARFEAERQALAMMDHPNIAKVLDAGTTGSEGRPYFVMELVQGVPITEYCDQCNLTTRERLKLFVTVCQAVQHAHQKGVIHRDIKPTNVLVAWGLAGHHRGDGHAQSAEQKVPVPVPRGDKPLVKIIDFGVAKAIGEQPLTERTLTTAFAQMVGTPMYMSPEQAELSPLGVDTRSDIYSLGVLLYELLTGTTPFDKDRLHSASYDELRRIIREEEPPRPSTRLSSLRTTSGSLPLAGMGPNEHGRPMSPERSAVAGREARGEGEQPSTGNSTLRERRAVAATTIAERRRTVPRRLMQTIRGELDWIVMKALEKDRNRRYETASALAADIEHYLHDEPVEACPPSAAYRLRKFLRRNKGPALAACATLFVLICGVIGTTWGMIRAGHERRLAEISAQQAIASAEAEKAAKILAQAREAETKAALDFVQDKVFAAARPEGHDGGLGHDVTLRKAVESALRFVDESFTDQPLIEARLRWTLGISFSHLGEARIAIEQFERVRALYTRHYGPNHSHTLTSMTNMASAYSHLGRDADALQLREETLARYNASHGRNHPHTLASMNDLASSYYSLGNYAEALKLWQETLKLRKAAIGPNHPDTLASMANLATGYEALGRHGEALQLREETLALYTAELGPDHVVMLKSMHNLANSYAALGRNPDALKLREETLALCRAKLGPEHADTLTSMGNLASSYFLEGRYADALKLQEEAFALWKGKFGPDHPMTLRNMQNAAYIYSRLHREADALRLREEALALWESKFGADHPDTLRSMNELAQSYAALGRDEDALKLREEALAVMKTKLGSDHPDTLWSMGNLAHLYVALGRHDEAQPIIDDCLARAAGQTVHPQLVPMSLEARLRVLQMKKDPAACLETVNEWEALNRTDAASLYYSAHFRAFCATVIRDVDKTSAGDAKAKAQADQAMAWLKQAVAAGYKDIDSINDQKSLDVLRDREDFKKLLAELERNEG